MPFHQEACSSPRPLNVRSYVTANCPPRPAPSPQGLVTGLALAPNPAASGPGGQGGPEAQRAELLVLTDWVRSALAGNLRWGMWIKGKVLVSLLVCG